MDLHVVFSVEPVERSRVCVMCWYGELKVYKNYSDIGGLRYIRWVLTCSCGRSEVSQIKVSTGMHRSTNSQSKRAHC